MKYKKKQGNFLDKYGNYMENAEKTTFIASAFRQLQAQGRVKTQGDFAKLLGVSQNTISAAKNGDERYLTESLIQRIQALLDSKEAPEASILVIPTEAMAGSLGEFADSVAAYDCERMISPIKGADYAIKIYGESMSPEYPSGSIVLIKKVNEQAFIEWGKVYVLDTDNGAVIKRVRRTELEDVVECVSFNPDFQPFRINKKYIRGWYRVLMVLSLK